MMKERKKILYLMHVPWGWIKQRPHFFAELLSTDYNVDLYYKKSTIVSKKNLLTTTESDFLNLKIKGFRYLPFEQIPIFKYLPCGWINTLLLLFQLPSFKKYDYIWITSPLLYSMIHPFIRRDSRIIYDCMDDALEFPAPKSNKILYNKLLNNEVKLLETSNYVICSAGYLKNKILNRAGLNREILVVNNAIALPEEKLIVDHRIIQMQEELKGIPFILMYIGAISEWFDFESVLYSLDNNPDAHLVLFGPSDVTIPDHERIHYMGTIERKYIFTVMSFAHALIMPFKINELIRSVNPVKIYEYIYTAKPIIVSKYEETLKFSNYVYYYTEKEEFTVHVSDLIAGRKQSSNTKDRMKEFALSNTWDARYKLLHTLFQ
ncbi:hypothetical protein [uncultured Bacteroides sp.]|uniref:hypothetical protein n=1 Tax=uncultured Bacteroides sp. TaxID=162156 RepID=UPI002626934D|nr:hypothetical protein [uncultured Bacteroides sp.]